MLILLEYWSTILKKLFIRTIYEKLFIKLEKTKIPIFVSFEILPT